VFLDVAIVDRHAVGKQLSSVLVRARKGPGTNQRAEAGV
jgi:hypothetical protein